MEKCEVRESVYEAVESWRRQLEAIEVDGGDCSGGEIVGWVVTVEAGVAAHIGANPGFCYSKWVGGDGVLECLYYGINQGQSLVDEP